MKPRRIILAWSSGWPLPFGKTRSISPFGYRSFHSRSVFNTSGGIGTVRSPEWDLGLPILPQSALAHMQLSLTKVHILPAQPTQLGRSQAGGDCSKEERPPTPSQLAYNGLDLVPRRNVKLALATLVGGDRHVPRYVLRHIATPRRVLE